MDTIPGIAPYSALSSVLGGVSRFPDSKHAAAYLGLVPSLYQPGNRSYTGHITKAGDPMLRGVLVQCARAAIKSDKKMREAYLNIRHRGGDKKAIIAIARKLVAHAYVMLKGNLTYGELISGTNYGEKAPGNE